jgi:large subunit ribosomal protein L21
MKESAPYAIIQSGGKQFRVFEGDVIDVELLAPLGEESASSINFKDIIFLHDGDKAHVGAALSSASVKAEIVGTIRGKKVVSYKYKKRKNCRRKVGHRQFYTRVKITEIGGSSRGA